MAAFTSSRPQPAEEPGSWREQKKQRTYQRLVDSAWRLFQEHGYEQTTVEDIALGADVAKSTFFNYFETKQAILDEVALGHMDQISRQVLSGADLPSSAVARIKLVMGAVAHALRSDQELLERAFLFRLSAQGKHEGAHRLGSVIHKLVALGQARQEIRADVDPRLISRLLMTCFFFSFPPPVATTDPEQGTHPAGHARDPKPRVLAAEFGFGRSIDALMTGLGGPDWREP